MSTDRDLLEEERDLVLGTIRLLGEAGSDETIATDALFMMLGVNTYRLSLDTPMPLPVRRQIEQGMAAVRDAHHRALRRATA